MADAVADIVGGDVSGLIIVPHGVADATGAITTLHGGHPVPDRDGLNAAHRLRDYANACRPGDLVVGVWSGGGSALLALPRPGLSDGDLRDATARLLASGLPIDDVNAVRRRLGALSGGRLAEHLADIEAIHLWLADVPPGKLRLATIASGPVVPDPLPAAVAAGIAARAGLSERICAFLTADSDDIKPAIAAQHVVIADTDTAVGAALDEARSLGWIAHRGDRIVGEAREIGASLAVPPPGHAWIAGGEATVTVAGSGRGGRCQELALAAAIAFAGRDFALLAAGTDGRDGPTDAAGAVADGSTATRARAAGVDPDAALARNDAWAVFAATGDHVTTGPTGTNVNDLLVVLGEPPTGTAGSSR